MSKTKIIANALLYVIVGVVSVVALYLLCKAMDAHDAKVKAKQSSEIYVPVPKNDYSRGYYVCSKFMETQITSPHFECFGSLYSCNGMPVVKCADGTAYFNPTDLKLDCVNLVNRSQILKMRQQE